MNTFPALSSCASSWLLTFLALAFALASLAERNGYGLLLGITFLVKLLDVARHGLVR